MADLKRCTEVIWHGRGGQGAFTAARLLGCAYILEGGGRCALAFPSFGPERRGAPVRAFTRMSGSPVNSRSEITDADMTVYLDDSLFFGAAEEDGKVIVNSSKTYDDPRIVSFDASALSSKILGSQISNTAMVAVLAAVWNGISLDSLRKGIKDILPERLHEKNIKVAEEAFRAAGGIS